MIKRFDIEPLEKFLCDDYTILVPNQRIRDSLLCAYTLKSDSDIWFTPDINAVDVWLKNTWIKLASQGRTPFTKLRIIDSTEELLVWIDIVEQDQQKTALLNIEETAASAQQAYQLYRLWLDDGSPDAQFPASSGIPELTLFASWSRDFYYYCQSQQLISLADATHLLFRELASGDLELPRKFVAVNFYQPPPVYMKLLRLLVSNWNTRHIQTSIPLTSSVGVRHSFADIELEARACANWASAITREQPDAHVGIIIADEQNTRPVIERILKETLNPEAFVDLLSDQPLYNGISPYRPVIDNKSIGDALLLLNLGNPLQDTEDFCRVLRSSNLLGGYEELEERVQLEKYLRENLGRQCSVSQLIQIMSREGKPYYCPILKNIMLTVVNQSRSHKSTGSPSEWANYFTNQLQLLGWPQQYSNKNAEIQELEDCWWQITKSFATHQPRGGVMSRNTAISRLRTLCQKTSPPFAFDPTRAISLYRMNDATGLQFTHTWFLGFTDQAQPPPVKPSPFISHRMQKEAGIPGSHSDVQLALAQQNFDILCASTTGEIHASHHLANDDERFRASSLITKLQVHEAPLSEARPFNELDAIIPGDLTLETLENELTVPLREDEQTEGGQSIFSDQSACPFRAFANHRLRARPLEPLTNGLDSKTRGTAMHIALEKLFCKITDSRQLKLLSNGQIQQAVLESVDAALDFLIRRRQSLMTPAFSEIERRRMLRLLEQYIELEKQRDDFQVIATEKSVRWQHKNLAINLKIDRIDKLGDQKLGIIDYKTGKRLTPLNSLTETRPEDLQLPLYYCAVTDSLEADVGSVVIAQMATGSVKFHGLAEAANFHSTLKPVNGRTGFDSDWASLTSEWRNVIVGLAEEYIEGIARVSPIKGSKTCSNCKLQSLCRIRQLDSALQNAALDEEADT